MKTSRRIGALFKNRVGKLYCLACFVFVRFCWFHFLRSLLQILLFPSFLYRTFSISFSCWWLLRCTKQTKKYFTICRKCCDVYFFACSMRVIIVRLLVLEWRQCMLHRCGRRNKKRGAKNDERNKFCFILIFALSAQEHWNRTKCDTHPLAHVHLELETFKIGRSRNENFSCCICLRRCSMYRGRRGQHVRHNARQQK